MTNPIIIKWTPRTHHMFSGETQREIATLLTTVTVIPYELLWLIAEYLPHKNEIVIQKHKDGSIWHFQLGKLHRERDLPAIEYPESGRQEWWWKGQKHRAFDRPAIIVPEGDEEEWWVDGKRHRINGPAIIHKVMMVEEWYLEGKLHRLDGPAVIDDFNQIEAWYKEGRRHRDGGPAYLDNKNKIVKYFLEGVEQN